MSDPVETLNNYLESWSIDSDVSEIIPLLKKIAELFEKEYEAYLKTDPDPCDQRHPSRAKPDCIYGTLLKNLFKNEELMEALITHYLIGENNEELHIVTARLLLDSLPGLEVSMVFGSSQPLIDELFRWAFTDREPMQSYATGLLAAAMELQEVATEYKPKNAELIPVMLKKLQKLMDEKRKSINFNNENKKVIDSNHNESYENTNESFESATKRRRISSPTNDCSNSSWAEQETFVIGSSKIYPLTNEIRQRFIYQYLTQVGEYADFLNFVFEFNVLSMILETIDLNRNPDIRLAFESLKYLASLICHKKFALEFINHGGIEALLKVYRNSLAASGVGLCLSIFSYHEDIMEKIVNFVTQKTLEELVSYSLFLIERSHDSSRVNAMIFFGLTFQFKVILDIFEKKDGLRKVINQISMITLFDPENFNSNDDEFSAMRCYAKYICYALKSYFQTSLLYKVKELIENNSDPEYEQYSRLYINWSPYKTMNVDYDFLIDSVEAMLHLMKDNRDWEPVDKFMQYDGPKILIQYISKAYGWNFLGKADSVRTALDIMVICSVLPKFQLSLTEEFEEKIGLKIILDAASGEIVPDTGCKCAALQIIINCVGGPIKRYNKHVMPSSIPSPAPSYYIKNKICCSRCIEELEKIWSCIRLNNGIMMLIDLIMTKTPITDADAIRALSCKALCGLARSESAREIISKLPLFTNGQIHVLMKEPILQDKRKEHLNFCKYCLELINLVTGSKISNLETSFGDLNKAEVITQTKIIFNENELLKLIHNHLNQKGLTKTAALLLEEANLNDSLSSSLSSPPMNNRQQVFRNVINSSTPPKPMISKTPRQISLPTSTTTSVENSTSSITKSSSSVTLGNSIKINRVQKNKLINNNNINRQQKNQSPIISNNRKTSFHFNSPIITKKKLETIHQHHQSNNPKISLDSIIVEYLRKQHALCKNPVITCPPFDLFKPHRCPEPKRKNFAPYNIASRIIRRQYFPSYGGFDGYKLNRKFIYSRYRPYRLLRSPGQPGFSSCSFSHNSDTFYIGSDTGDLHFFNYLTGEYFSHFPCYQNSITHLEPSWNDKHILTTTSWDDPNSILWKINDYQPEQMMSFDLDNYVEFGKYCQDKVLGTQNQEAHLYDLNTKSRQRTFNHESLSNDYEKNLATLNYDDILVLNDGVLWDVREPKPLHKFDKFNQTINGLFHPNGLEIISSSEIWDIRTYKLLQTVPALANTFIKFSGQGHVIYALNEEETREGVFSFGTSFRVFDGHDYSSIATIDVKKTIAGLAVNKNDRYIGLIESLRDYSIFSNQEEVVRIYEIGRKMDGDDDNDVEDEEDDSDDDDEEDNDDEEEGDDEDSDDDNRVIEVDLDFPSDDSSFEIQIDSDDDSDNDDDTSSRTSTDRSDQL